MAILSLPSPVAFVLTGGSSNGAAQAGMLRAVEEAGLAPDLVTGTSVGAINGAIVAVRPEGSAQRLIDIWSGLRTSDVFSDGLLTRIGNLVTSRRYLYSGRGLRSLIQTHVQAATFADLTIPFVAVATDVMGGHPVELTSGALVDAISASAAIPGVLPNVRLGGQLLMDGGVVANAPVRAALNAGAASIVVFDAGYACHLHEPPKHLAARVLHATSVMLRRQVERDVEYVAERVPVVFLPPLCPLRVSPLDFSNSLELIAEGYETSRRFIASLRIESTSPRLYGHLHRHDGPTSDHAN